MADLRFDYETIQTIMGVFEQTRAEAETTMAGYTVVYPASDDPIAQVHDQIRQYQLNCLMESVDFLSQARAGAQAIDENFREADRAGHNENEAGAGE